MLQTQIKRWRRQNLIKDVERAAAGKLSPVIIFQMGKVASSTIEATLERVPGLAVFRTHGLVKWGDVTAAPTARRELESWLILHRLVRPGISCKVVSAVRDPIARNLSAYFQNLDQLHGVHDAHASLPMSKLVAGFFELHRHARPLEWFDAEFAAILGLNVYQHPFDQLRGFQRIKSDQFDVLVLRSETDDETKAQQLAEWVGTRSLRIIQKNIGETKSYAAVYREFLRSIRLPDDYVATMMDHQFTRHFFMPEAIAAMRKKWTAA